MAVPASAWVPLAQVARPHGVRGELRLRPFNVDSDLLLKVRRVRLRADDGVEREERVASARRANDAVLMKLGSVDDRDGAESLRGAVVCVRRSDFPPLEPGEFYLCDVEGARVVLEQAGGAGRDIGRVEGVRTYPAAQALVVGADDGGPPWEVPLVGPFVRAVDVSNGVVTLATLDGVERG